MLENQVDLLKKMGAP